MNLLILAPDIPEEILFMQPWPVEMRLVTEKILRPVLQTLVWSEQRKHRRCQDRHPLHHEGPQSGERGVPALLGHPAVRAHRAELWRATAVTRAVGDTARQFGLCAHALRQGRTNTGS